MKARMIALALPFVFVGMAMAFADSIHMGTWKLNEQKSKIPAGSQKNTTVVYEPAGDMVKVIVDGVDANGNPVHNEWIGKFDEKDYPVTGDPAADTRSYKVINSRTMTLANKKDGKIVVTGRIVASVDGKSRTVTTKVTNSQGKKVTVVAVYDKQ
jgi:hypothetical protein